MKSKLSRRHFLSAAASAAVAPLILPSRVFSADSAPSQRLNIGFIGMGIQSRGHVSAFLSRKECQVMAVCDVDTTRREDAKNRVNDYYAKNSDSGSYKGCDSYNEFEKILERDDIDLVLIATPDHWHAYIAKAAAAAGKDIYCEKPLTHNIHEAVDLVKAVREHNRVLQTGSQQRSSKEFRVACELVRNGVIGELKTITTSFGDPAKPNSYAEEQMEPGLDWDRWCGPGPVVPYSPELAPRGINNHFPNWRLTREFGGGMITDWGAHHIDIAQWGLGVDGSGPVKIIAPPNHETAKRGAKLVYANGVELTHADGKGVSFYGSEGEVHVNRGKFELVLGGEVKRRFMGDEDKGTSLDREVALAEKEFLADAKVKLYKSGNHHDDFLNSVRTREKPICDVEIGASTVIACHLMNQAYYHGGELGWNPETHQFTSGGDASWLTREYRQPWAV